MSTAESLLVQTQPPDEPAWGSLKAILRRAAKADDWRLEQDQIDREGNDG